MIITSTSNIQILNASKCKERKYIEKFGTILLESAKVIKDSRMYTDTIKIFVVESSREKYKSLLDTFDQNIIIGIDNKIAKKLSSLVDTSDIFALVKVPKSTEKLSSRVLILDNIQDPTNLGSIARTAKATGFDTLYLINCVYPYTPKVIRSSMCHILGLNIINCSIQDVTRLKNSGYKIISSDMNGENVFNISTNYDFCAIVIGNEGQGISDSLIKLSDKIVSIPMFSGVESLNASVSAGILMYEFGGKNVRS